ncbi:MAG TPA: DUF1634 domain-containing protein [Candidatus Binataceae bacterium]|nr:DUF1634 domain-containing protein [Candidatus Binataceae bacterium]
MELLRTVDDEDRILRHWTPIILRSILITAMVILAVGLILAATRSPGYYVGRFRLVQSGTTMDTAANWAGLTTGAAHGDPRTIMTLGLVVLTLVPIARVAFTFVLFVKERDAVFAAATAYVLAGLIAGILLGRIG